MHAILLLLCLMPLTRGYDLAVGLNNYGKKIFDETRQASPAIWRQKENVTIETPEQEVITKIIILDMRPEKDGDARIVDGGVGKASVTIELKSPTVFRGYDFHIFVYSAPQNQTNQTIPLDSLDSSTEDYKLHTNAANTESALITTEQPVKDYGENKRPVRTADDVNSGGNLSPSYNDTFSNSPENSTFGSAVSYASTNSNDESTTGFAASIASVTSAVDSTSGFVEASSNSGIGSPSERDPSPISTTEEPELTTEAIISSTEVTLSGYTENYINEGTTNSLEENISSTLSNLAPEAFTTNLQSNFAPEGFTTTLLPEINQLNGKDLPELNNMNGEGIRHPRKINEENIPPEDVLSENTTMFDFTNENSTGAPIFGIDEKNNEDTTNSIYTTDSSTESDSAEITTESNISKLSADLTATVINDFTEKNDVNTQGSTDSNMENDNRYTPGTGFEDSSDVHETTTILDELTTTEVYSGDREDTSDVINMSGTNYEISSTTTKIDNAIFNLMPDSTITEETIASHAINNSNSDESTETPQNMTPPLFTDQMLRNTRDASEIGNGILGDNFLNIPSNFGYNRSNPPIFVDTSHEASEQTNSSDFVYIPVIAMISKSSYPSFQQALQHLPGQSQTTLNATN